MTGNKLTKCTFAAAILIMVSLGNILAQTDDPMLFTMGTTASNHLGHSAYILWDRNENAPPPDEALAVYMRAGDLNATGTFTLKGVVQRQTDPRTIRLLINKAATIGQTEADLAQVIDVMFADLALDPSLSLESRIASVIQTGEDVPEVDQNLRFLCRRHAAIAMAMGQAVTIPLPDTNFHTFEIRAWNLATGTPGSVRGRVCVQGGSPRILPAPVNITGTTDSSPKGHLNIGMRWETTDTYKRQSLLGFGFNIYRMTVSFAVSHGYNSTPPLFTDLPALLAGNPNSVKKVNNLPVLIDEDELDPDDPFFVDDNDRFDEAGVPFTDGEGFYYFVTPCDVLGRDGVVSSGTLLRACDRMAPTPPMGMSARRKRTYDGAAREFSIEISWDQNEIEAGDETASYYVYRWSDRNDPLFGSRDPLINRIGGPVAHVPGQARNSYTDTTLGEADIGHRYTYTVRAVDNSSCGGNWSGHSAPVSENLRDEDGPQSGGGTVYIDKLSAEVTVQEEISSSDEALVDRGDFRLTCNFQNLFTQDNVAWVEFYQNLSTSAVPPQLIYRMNPQGTGAVTTTLFRAEHRDSYYKFYCRIELKDGTRSNRAVSNPVKTSKEILTYKVVHFTGLATITREVSDGGTHYTPPEDGNPPTGYPMPTNGPPTINIPMDSDSYEWRLYSKVDNGPLTLVHQGLGEPDSVVSNIQSDVSRYVRCATIKYYTQTFDNNGNPGPLTLADRFLISGPTVEPVEFVEIHDAGTTTNPAMSVAWVASPYGVDHFKLMIGFESGSPPAEFTGSLLSSNLTAETGNSIPHVDELGITRLIYAGTYITPRVGAAFGDAESNMFSVELPIEAGRKYYVCIIPVGQCREGNMSTWATYQWSAPANPTQVTVPWPDRPLPDSYYLNSDIKPIFIPHYDYGGTVKRNTAGIIVGQVNGTTERHAYNSYKLPTDDPIKSYLFNLREGATELMPFVLYRKQVANTLYPDVSGQVVQVSPMIEQIATEVSGGRTFIIDPFIVVGPRPPAQDGEQHDICIRDNMPVIAGATYQYMMVLFNDRGEIEETIMLEQLTIPTRLK